MEQALAFSSFYPGTGTSTSTATATDYITPALPASYKSTASYATYSSLTSTSTPPSHSMTAASPSRHDADAESTTIAPRTTVRSDSVTSERPVTGTMSRPGTAR